jgi:hypothetical protein
MTSGRSDGPTLSVGEDLSWEMGGRCSASGLIRIADRSGQEWANILLRWIQTAFILNATCSPPCSGGSFDQRAIVAVLPFLLWPFNADAVLWRGGSVMRSRPLVPARIAPDHLPTRNAIASTGSLVRSSVD